MAIPAGFTQAPNGYFYYTDGSGPYAIDILGVPHIMAADMEHLAKSLTAKVLTNGDIIFSVTGSVQLNSLLSECYTANGAGLTTLQYSVTTLLAQTASISGISASLANAIAGTAVVMNGATLVDPPNISPSGIILNTTARGIRIPAGDIKLVIAVGPTTGTWKHYLRWTPLEEGSTVVSY